MKDASLLSELARQHIRLGVSVREAIESAACEVLPRMAAKAADSFTSGGRLFLFGNGGSAADAQHIAAEFVNKLQRERPPLPAIALTVDTSIITAVSNDYRFEVVFSRQLAALGRPGDVALGISTSGCSANVINALLWARNNGLATLGFAGEAHSAMDQYCDLVLHIPCGVTQIIQECHIVAGHILCAIIEEIIFPNPE